MFEEKKKEAENLKTFDENQMKNENSRANLQSRGAAKEKASRI